ncbi:MAG TPA: efflux RND transporter periplasmic adaptor subunit [Desulfatiglandales bacterium]|nr:efflux RND transporter periplasmic adaptor subunit [Desulfatiglandales bacterium]
MNQFESDKKTGLLRYIWGVFPWFIVIILILSCLILVGNIIERVARLKAERKAATRQEVAVQVVTLTVKPTQLEEKLNLPAAVESFENLWVKSEASGQVRNILVKEGQMVQKGQVLVELDSRDYTSRLDRIEANYKLISIEHNRMSELYKRNIATASEMDKLDAQLKDMEAQLRETKLALERTKITAPISGRLNEIEAKIGDSMPYDKPVAQILQIGEVKVTVGIPESDVSAVMDLKEADIIIEALDRLKVKGRKLFLSRQPSDLARLYNLELVVDNPDGRILPGMFARVEIVKKRFEDTLAVPLYAVISQDDENFVYLEKNNKAEKRPVELGILEGWMIQVKSGLNVGDNVIIVGHRQVDEGQAVQVIKNVTNPAEILKS